VPCLNQLNFFLRIQQAKNLQTLVFLQYYNTTFNDKLEIIISERETFFQSNTQVKWEVLRKTGLFFRHFAQKKCVKIRKSYQKIRKNA